VVGVNVGDMSTYTPFVAFDLFLDARSGKTGIPLVIPREAAARSVVMEAMYQAAQNHSWVAPKTC